VLRDLAEAEQFEDRLQRVRGWRREFDELETHESHRILEQICHRNAPVFKIFAEGELPPA
jgi:hypothetical protein